MCLLRIRRTAGQTVWLDDYEILMACDGKAPAQ
jgi:hypothetical protein